jgi:hypothetical protein
MVWLRDHAWSSAMCEESLVCLSYRRALDITASHAQCCGHSEAETEPLLGMGLKNISQRWTMPIKNWSGAMNQFAILFDGRVPIGGLSSNSLTQNPA